MYATLETSSSDISNKGYDTVIRIDSAINSLSWMSKSSIFPSISPSTSSSATTASHNSQQPQQQSTESTASTSSSSNASSSTTRSDAHESEIKFDKFLYYQEGWLATGNSSSIIGCTYTTCLSEQQQEYLKAREERLKKKEISTPLPEITPVPSSTNATTTTITNTTSIESSSQTTSQPLATIPSSQPQPPQQASSSTLINMSRANFNMRGHKVDVKLVRWNEPYQKLASCDSKGLIYVWIKHDGRWSIELINDRGSTVSDFAWSHDGRMAVICYQDGFVLVGSVNGQRYWSHLYDLSTKTITCASWAPNDTFILLGLSDGSLMVLDENGSLLSRHAIKNDLLTGLAYNCPKFFIEELINLNNSATSANGDADASNGNDSFLSQRNRIRLSSNLLNFVNNDHQINNRVDSRLRNKINNSKYLLACSFKTNGVVYLMRNYEDIDPIVIDTKLEGVKMEWSNNGRFLAVGGYEVKSKSLYTTTRSKSSNNLSNKTNFVHFYNTSGNLIYKIQIPSIQIDKILNKSSTVDYLELKQREQHNQSNSSSSTTENKNDEIELFSALTWGHNDQRLFVACAKTLHVLRVFREIPKLSLLSQVKIKTELKEETGVNKFPLPEPIKDQLKYCFASTLKNNFPKLNQLKNFICKPLPNHERLHCTLKRMDIKSSYDYYTLYYEYLGGLIPLLSARKSSKVKPEFVIFDPFMSKSRTNNQNKPALIGKNKKELKKKNLKFVSPAKTLLQEPNKAPNLLTSSGYNSSGTNISNLEESSKQKKVKRFEKKVGVDSTTKTAANSNLTYAINSSFASLSSISSSSFDSVNELSFLNDNHSELMSNDESDAFEIDEEFEPREQQAAGSSKSRAVKKLTMSKKKKMSGSKRPILKKNNKVKSKNSKSKTNNTQTINQQRSLLKRNILVNIKSNLWGTRFKFIGDRNLPSFTGQIVYKTSLFHLQPRQMTITLEDLTNYEVPTKPVSSSVKPVRNRMANKITKQSNITVSSPPSTSKSISKESTMTTTSPTKPVVSSPAISLKQKLATLSNVSSAATSVALPSLESATETLGSSMMEISKKKVLNGGDIACAVSNSYAKLNTDLSSSSTSLIDLDQIKANCKDALSTVNELFEAKFRLDAQKEQQQLLTKSMSQSTLTASNSSLSSSVNNVPVASEQAPLAPGTITEFNLPRLTLTAQNSIDDYYYCVEKEDEDEETSACYLITSVTISSDLCSRADNEPLLLSNQRVLRTPNGLNKYNLFKSSSSGRQLSRLDHLINYVKTRKHIQSLLETLSTASLANMKFGGSSNNDDGSLMLGVSKSTTAADLTNTAKESDYEDIEELNGETELRGGKKKLFSRRKNNSKANNKKNLSKTFQNEDPSNNDTNLSERKKSAKASYNKKGSGNHIVLHNKPPIWNETSQVYQLDFGGRVTQESAKNFQIEHMGRQVMQFGRTDTNAYTLDFQWPFSTVQAFSIALANITQRLK